MIEFHKIWVEQCEAAEGIKEEFGSEKALGYLIGEKLLNFIEASDERPEFAAELSKFVQKIKSIFQPWEIAEYVSRKRRTRSDRFFANWISSRWGSLRRSPERLGSKRFSGRSTRPARRSRRGARTV